jgi:hypothetical protein
MVMIDVNTTLAKDQSHATDSAPTVLLVPQQIETLAGQTVLAKAHIHR